MRAVLLLLSLFCLLANGNAEGLRIFQTTVTAFEWFRYELPAQARTLNGQESIVLKGSPQMPDWMEYLQQSKILFGTIPDLFSSSVLEIISVNATHLVQSQLELVLDHSPDSSPEVLIQFPILNFNKTQLLQSPYPQLISSIETFNVQFSSVLGQASLILHGVDLDGSLRNLPPDTFDPPRAPPNAWIGSFSSISIISFAEVTLTCSSLEASLGIILRNAGFQTDFDACMLDNFPASAIGSRPPVEPVDPNENDWTRSTDIFDGTFVPCLIIALIILIIGLIVAIIHCCTKSDEEAILLQRERLILNKLARNRTYAFRQENDDPAAFGEVAPRFTYLGAIPDEDDVQNATDIRSLQEFSSDLPPPKYYMPPPPPKNLADLEL